MINYSNKPCGEVEQIKNDYRKNGLEEYCIGCGTTVEQFAKDFIEFLKSPRYINRLSSRIWFADFNNRIIFSNDENLTEDNIVKFITGKTIAEKHKAEQKEREELLRKEAEWKASIPKMSEKYILKGYKILDTKYWDMWEKCVPIRLGDLYHGMELDCFLDLMKMIKKGDDFEKIYKVFQDQGHSYMSYNLVKVILRDFGGADFIEWINATKGE